MSNRVTYKQYREMVEQQGKAMLDALAFVATGNVEIEIEIPEGIDIMTDLAIGITYLIDDLRELITRQEQAQIELEQRVAERTQELEQALHHLQIMQSRYVRQEWEAYTAHLPQEEDDAEEPWLPAMTKAVEAQETSSYANGEETASVALPIHYGDELIGVLGFAKEAAQWDKNEITAVETVIEQVGLALENQRLFDQTQEALQETETLYKFNSHLSTVQTLKEVTASITAVGNAYLANEVNLLLTKEHRTNRTIMLELVASHAQFDEAAAITGTQFAVTDLPAVQAAAQNPNTPLLIEDVAHSDVKIATNTAYLRENTQSLAILPLYLAEEWLGVILVQWTTAQTFTDHDQRFYKAMAEQTAVIVNQTLLRIETQQRASQLEKLTQIETSLSQADNDDEILQALLEGVDTQHFNSISLSFFNEVGESFAFDLASQWLKDKFLNKTQLAKLQNIPIETFPVIQLWLENPYEILYIEDIENDPRATPTILEQAQDQKWRSLVLLPLRSAGQWQGMLSLSWFQPHLFTNDELFLFERLLEPVAAIVAFRRSLKETALLYRVSTEINTAQTYDDLLTVLRKHTLLGNNSQYITFNYFDTPWTHDYIPEWITITARWTQEGVPETLSQRYHLAHYPSLLKLLRPLEPLIIEDVAHDPRLGENLRTLYRDQFKIVSTIFVPFVVGGQWIGFIHAMYTQPATFPEQGVHRLMLLSRQVAVAVQTIYLFNQSERRAEELAILNEMGRTLTIIQGVDTILDNIYQYTARLMDATNFYIAFHHPHKSEIAFPLAIENGKKVKWASRRAGQGMTEFIIQHKKTLLIEEDVEGWLKTQGIEQIGMSTQSWLGAPMIRGNEIIGVIVVQSQTPGLYGVNHRELLRAIASQSAIAIQNMRLLATTQEQLTDLQTIQQTTSDLTAALTLNEAVNALLPQLINAVQANSASIHLVEGDQLKRVGTYLKEKGVINAQEFVPLTDYPLTQQVIKTGEPMVLTTEDPQFPAYIQYTVESAKISTSAIIPLRGRKAAVLGILSIHLDQPNRAFNDQEIRLLQTLADQATIAFERVRLQEETERRARREQLLRQITAEVRRSANVDTIMKTAVKEVGRALGKETFIRLSDTNETQNSV